MPDRSSYPTLFSPVSVGTLSLANRLVHASISTRMVTDGKITERLIDYYVNRALGGVSMAITEPLSMLARQHAANRIDVANGTNDTALARWAAKVAQAGAALIGQLQDSGRGRHVFGRGDAPIGASALADDLSWTVPRALGTIEVDDLIAEFAASAGKLKEFGFAGVEISAGHGHLFHQFLSPCSNRRRDEYGGDTEGRSRILTRLIRAIRERCGVDFVIGAKLPAADGVKGGIDLPEAAKIAGHVAATGAVDYWTFAWGTHANTLDWHLPDPHGPRTPYLKDIKDLRQSAPDIPTGALGLITDPNEAEHALADGTADLVILGRALITDAAWGKKAQAGREADIRYCVSCNTCWQSIIERNTLACDNNPRVGEADEADWQPARAKKASRVTIVGAGIAGLEAAWVAAARGHAVTVLGASADVGGKTRLHAALPGAEGLSSIYDYQYLRATSEGVRFELGVPATLDDVLATRPDSILLATGSTMRWPDFLPAEFEGEGIVEDARALAGSLIGRSDRTRGMAVLYDHDHTVMTYRLAELLADRFTRVTIVTPRERIAGDVSLVTRLGIYRRLHEKRVRIITCSEPLAGSPLEDGVLKVANIYNDDVTELEDIAVLTYATARRPNDRLMSALSDAGIGLQSIGDCRAPRDALAATSEGYNAALRVGN